MRSIYKYSCCLVREEEFAYDVKCVNPNDVYKFLCDEINLDIQTEEYSYMLTTDAKGNIIGIHEISHGTISNTLMSPKDILKRAIINNACGIILAHNHPSGDATPSSEDIAVTRRIKEAAEILEIKLVDHLIIGDNSYVSLRKTFESSVI